MAKLYAERNQSRSLHMKLISYHEGGNPRYGIVTEGGVIDASARRR